MGNHGLTAMVREAAKQQKGQFPAKALLLGVEIYTSSAVARVYSRVIPDMVKRGELRRISRGVFQYVHPEPPRGEIDVIWHLIRSHRQFSIDEIERLSGCCRNTCYVYLAAFAALGYLRSPRRSHYQLIKDPGPATPRAIKKRVDALRKAEAA